MHDISTTIFNIGLTEPVKLLHITDIHITKANDQDSDMYKELMKTRVDTFYNEGKCPPSTPSEYFEKAIALAKEKDALLINTGDAIDLHINGCLEEYKKIADGVDMTDFKCRFGRGLLEAFPTISKYAPEHVTLGDNRAAFTEKGMMVSNFILSDILDFE